MGRWLYRLRQFLQAVTARVDEQGFKEAQETLAPPLLALFYRLQTSEQVHSLWVYRSLCNQKETHPDLLSAALLHDIGKILHPLTIWQRIEIVLANRLVPDAVKRWGNAPPTGWRKPFVVAAQHPAWGAELAQKAGASPLVVSLIRRHQQTFPAEGGDPLSEEDFLLTRLKTFDDES